MSEALTPQFEEAKSRIEALTDKWSKLLYNLKIQICKLTVNLKCYLVSNIRRLFWGSVSTQIYPSTTIKDYGSPFIVEAIKANAHITRYILLAKFHISHVLLMRRYTKVGFPVIKSIMVNVVDIASPKYEVVQTSMSARILTAFGVSVTNVPPVANHSINILDIYKNLTYNFVLTIHGKKYRRISLNYHLMRFTVGAVYNFAVLLIQTTVSGTKSWFTQLNVRSGAVYNFATHASIIPQGGL